MKPKYVNSLTNTNRILNLLQDQVKCDHDTQLNKSELDLEGVMFTPCPAAWSKADVKSEISISCVGPCRQWADQVRTPHCLLPQAYTQWWETTRDICGHKLTTAWWREAEPSWRPGATLWGPARGERRQVGQCCHKIHRISNRLKFWKCVKYWILKNIFGFWLNTNNNEYFK